MICNKKTHKGKETTVCSSKNYTSFFKELSVIFVFFLMITTAPAQEKRAVNILPGKVLENKIRLNFIPVDMPIETFPNLKSTMGLLGVHYQVPINNWLYGGVGIYAALTGDQGGLFTLGAELGVNKRIFNDFYLDANLHFGGGGGYRYLVKDGAFINPNFGLQYKKENYAFGIQYSHLNFFTGKIKSDAISFFIEIPSILRFTDYKEAQQQFISENKATDSFWYKPATKNVQEVRFEFLFPFGDSKKDNGTELTAPLYALGFEYQKYINQHTFVFAHTDAIYKGLRAGFMDLFIGAGYHPYQTKSIDLFTKLAVGAAGGRIAPEGGLTIYPTAGLDIKFTNTFALSAHGGYYKALAGDFEAYTIGFGLKYINSSGGTLTENTKKTNTFYTQGIRVNLQNQSYFKVAKTDDDAGILNPDLQLLALQFNYDLNPIFYLIGEAGFAYSGRSGGYAQGLAGFGAHSSLFFNTKMQAFIEGVAGAGGGAGVDTGEGIIVRPTIGLQYHFSNAIAFSASAGKLISPFGNVNATNINIGLSFGLATLNTKN